ncbi:MAG: hypothetical protein DRQ55_19505 [Planctomycetota bacterium]|nr:MAG: hypothetical protein DRQ55_19505 [Planctomycetota bacterium]
MRRHALTVVLSAAAVWVFVGTTLPALEQQTLSQRRTREAERVLEQRSEQVQRHELLLETSLSDPMIRERLRANLLRSPDLAGPRVLTAAEVAAEAAERATAWTHPQAGTAADDDWTGASGR